MMAIHRKFERSTDRVTSGVTYTFDQDGGVKIRREHFMPHRMETATSSFDPAPNYEIWPDFGIYDQLIRVDRR